MGQEEGPLTLIEISLLEYESEGETSTDSALPLYMSSLPTLLLLLLPPSSPSSTTPSPITT